ncbi:uncharacterized protein LOC134529583 [Bacillus rossius redtenbacheri]|uniref:uncharacterized protein LOC134529583 n=1 Tax=Bacillus rossius redtenbacheri TaxID=93214 RepID=UPI002FDDBF3E
MSGHILRTQGRPPDAASRTGTRQNCHTPQSVQCLQENSYPSELGPAEKGTRCLILLERCLAIKLLKVSFRPDGKKISESRSLHNRDFWMYDNGYLLFQDFLEQNLKCFWNTALLEAVRVLKFRGYVAPGVLMVTANPCALEVVRSAWSRNVLRPPTNFIILIVGDISDCVVEPLPQGHFTPLPEALCWVILELTSAGQSAVLPEIFSALQSSFPDMEVPSNEVVYDVLAQLMAEEKVYQTSKGFFVMTPERKRREINHYRRHRKYSNHSKMDPKGTETYSLLMSPEEALVLVHGEMQTIRDGDVTHQSLQTNLADIICGGNPNDKIIHPRIGKKNPSSPLQRHTDRRHSLRLFGSSKHLSSPSRCSSMRHIPNKHALKADHSSSTECHSAACNRNFNEEKKPSFLSRLFRRSVKKRASMPAASLSTFGAQFPPTEWFNPRVVHLHSVGTQTQNVSSKLETPLSNDLVSSITPWTDEGESKAATLPRRHRRLASRDSAISLTTYNQSHTVTTTSNSTPRSSRRHRSPSFRCQAQQQVHSFYEKSDTLSCSTSRNSVIPNVVSVPLPNSSLSPAVDMSSECCKPQAPAVSAENNISCNRKAAGLPPVFPNTNKLSSSLSRSSYSVKSSVVCSSHKVSNKENVCSNKTVTVKRHENHEECDLTNGIPTNTYSNEKPVQAKSKLSCPMQNNSSQYASQTEENKNCSHFQMPGLGNVTLPNSSCSGQNSSKNEEIDTALLKNGHTNGSLSTVQSCDFMTSNMTVTSSAVYANSSSNSAISECNTKINLQENSPGNPVITFENGVKNDNNGCVHARAETVHLNCYSVMEKESSPSLDENDHLNRENNCETDTQLKLNCPDSLNNLKEPSNSNSIHGGREYKNVKNDGIENVVEAVEPNQKHDSDCNNDCKNVPANSSGSRRSSGILLKFGNGNETDITLYHNTPRYLRQNSYEPTTNNVQKWTQTTTVLPVKSKEELDYKNVFQRDLSLFVDGSFSLGMKNDVMNNTQSMTKSFDSFGGSFGNLFLKDSNNDDKFNAPNAQEVVTELKNLDDMRYSIQDRDNEDKVPRLSPCTSLSDLRVSFKSITAQNIMKGISISSIDTLLEVNVAVAEKKGYDMSICTDLGRL